MKHANKNNPYSIYFAGPLFCNAETTFNLKITHLLEDQCFTVFLPQRDGVEEDKPEYIALPKEQRRKLIFTTDRDQTLQSDIFLFVLDGRIPDEGACVELGIAYTQKFLGLKNKLIIGLHSDIRSAFIGSRLNPMLNCCFDYIATNEKDLMAYLINYQIQQRVHQTGDAIKQQSL